MEPTEQGIIAEIKKTVQYLEGPDSLILANAGLGPGVNQLTTSVTWPEATVWPPSRMANLSPFSMAMG